MVVDHPAGGTGASGFGTFKETLAAEPYRGKRARLRLFAQRGRRERIVRLRVGEPSGMTAFDTWDRAPTGTREGTSFSIVLNVPAGATQLVGLLLQGAGTFWADDLRIDFVDLRVPTTSSI